MAGDDGDVGSGCHHADSRLEGSHGSIPSPSTFGEQDVNAGFIDESSSELSDGVCSDLFSPDRQSVEHGGREGGECGSVEEDVSGGERKQLVSEFQRQCGSEDECIEVAGVIGDEDKRG